MLGGAEFVSAITTAIDCEKSISRVSLPSVEHGNDECNNAGSANPEHKVCSKGVGRVRQDEKTNRTTDE